MTARERQVMAYANLIRKGALTIDAVPKALQEEVNEVLSNGNN